MIKIKLYKVSEMNNGTIRLQSQLMVGKDSVDFILENDILKCWGNGKNGFDFYKTEMEYEIVTDINEMKYQQIWNMKL